MALPKSIRSGVGGSPSTYIITGSVLVGFSLIAIWVFSAPAAIPVSSQGGSVLNTNKHSSESINGSSLKAPNSFTTEEDSWKERLLDPVTKEPAEDQAPLNQDNHSTMAETQHKELPDQAELTTDKKEAAETDFETQTAESREEKEASKHLQAADNSTSETTLTEQELGKARSSRRTWKLCDFKNAQDFIPCLDNKKAIKKLGARKHYEHRERHCHREEELPKCLLPLPKGYKVPINWPISRDQVWLSNVPHTQLVSYKADQNWVKVSPDQQKLIFPGGGTQFKHGASHYIDFLQETVPAVAWGTHTRVILDVGCGVASFGGYLSDKDVLAMSIAPKDEHEAQVQMALERGIPAVSSVMGTQRLAFPSNVFDAVHCARCRVPWYRDGGMLLFELNRVLRPGGFFLYSATPVYMKDEIKKWEDIKAATDNMSWTLVAKKYDPTSKIGVAIFQKPKDNGLYNLTKPPFCEPDDKPDAAWYVPLKACIHKLPATGARASNWPAEWPLRVETTPSWLSTTGKGIYGSPMADEYHTDTAHWKRVIEKSYLQGLGIQWSCIRNVMDMKAGYGGFAAALLTQPVWVMNILPVTEPDTLPIIFDRGLVGMYHDWCEPHSTYPRSYDLMHADHLFSTHKEVQHCECGDGDGPHSTSRWMGHLSRQGGRAA